MTFTQRMGDALLLALLLAACVAFLPVLSPLLAALVLLVGTPAASLYLLTH